MSQELKELEEKQKQLSERMEAALKATEQAVGQLKELPKHREAQEKKLSEMEKALAELRASKADESFKALEEKVNALLTQKAERKMRWPGEGEGPGQEEKFSLIRMFRAMATRDWEGAKVEKLALGTATGPAGGFLVPEEYVKEIKDRITAQAVLRRAGATTYPMTGEVLNIPRISGGVTAYWLGENTQIPATDPTFAQMQLVAKLLAGMVKVSNQLLADAIPQAEAAIRRDIAKSLALEEDISFLGGTGTGAQPKGIINTAGVNEVTLGANGGTPTFDTIYDALYEVERNNGVATAWIMHPRTKNTLRKIKDSQGHYIYTLSPSLKEPDTLVGLPVFLTTQIPINLTVGSSTDCSYVVVAQFDEAIIGERLGMEFAVDQSGTAFESYQTWIRAISRLDFGLRTPEVFCKVTGVRP